MADRNERISWCDCGQPWLPAAGLFGTTEETQCHGCTLRERLARENVERERLSRDLARLTDAWLCDACGLDVPEEVAIALSRAASQVRELLPAETGYDNG